MGILPRGWDTLQKRQRKNWQPVFMYTKLSVCSRTLHFHQARCCLGSQFILSDPEVHLFPKHIGRSSCKTCQKWGLQDRLLYSSRLSNLSFPFIADKARNTAQTVPILPHLLPTGNHRFSSLLCCILPHWNKQGQSCSTVTEQFWEVNPN